MVIDFIDPREYGCVCDGTSDDTTNFQNTVKIAAMLSRPLRLPAGKIRITGMIEAHELGNLCIEGGGPQISQLIIDGEVQQAGLAYSGVCTNDTQNNQVVLRNFGMRCVGQNIIDVVNLRFEGGNGATTQSAIIENVEISRQDESAKFVRGFSLWNARNSKIRAVRVDGHPGIVDRSAGIYLDGDAQPVEFFISDCNLYNLEAAIRIVGQKAGEGLEGVYIQQCAVVACRYGVHAFTPYRVSHPFIKISGCQLNCYNRNISIKNFVHCIITGNLLYAADDSMVHEFVGVELSVCVDWPETNQHITLVSNNILLGVNRPNGDHAYKAGIHVWNGSEVLITDNFFGGFSQAIWLDADTTNNVVSDTNRFPPNANGKTIIDNGKKNIVL